MARLKSCSDTKHYRDEDRKTRASPITFGCQGQLWFGRGRWRRMRVRLDRIRQQRIEFRTRHLQLLGMRIDVLAKPFKLCRRPTPFELSPVLAFTVQFEVVVVHQVGELRLADCGFSESCRNKDDSVG